MTVGKGCSDARNKGHHEHYCSNDDYRPAVRQTPNNMPVESEQHALENPEAIYCKVQIKSQRMLYQCDRAAPPCSHLCKYT